MTCPICGRETAPKYRPFCARRCADVDLGRWVTGSYVLPGPEAEEGDTAPGSGAESGPDEHGTKPRRQ